MAIGEADYSMTDMALGNQSMAEADKTLLVKFYIAPVENQARSAAEGRLICEDKEHISIKIPGNRGGGVNRVAREGDKQRFPEHYAAFRARIKAGLEAEEKIEGTLLKHWGGISASSIEELTFLKVYTVEALAALSDTNCQNMSGLLGLRERAKEWLEQTQGSEAKLAEQAQQIEEQASEIAELKAQMKALMAAEKAPVKKKPGRPKKAAAEKPEDTPDKDEEQPNPRRRRRMAASQEE